MGSTAVLAAAPLVIVGRAADSQLAIDLDRGQPFDDGTWFDDGFGWVD